MIERHKINMPAAATSAFMSGFYGFYYGPHIFSHIGEAWQAKDAGWLTGSYTTTSEPATTQSGINFPHVDLTTHIGFTPAQWVEGGATLAWPLITAAFVGIPLLRNRIESRRAK